MMLAALTGSAAMADSRDRDNRHDNRGHDNRDHGRDDQGRGRNWDRHDDRRDWQRDSRSYRERSWHRYHAPRYHPPHNYRYRAWHRGEYLPSAYYAPRYVVRDYHSYNLYAPPRGYHWVRVGDDVLLAAIAGGVVAAVVTDLFY